MRRIGLLATVLVTAAAAAPAPTPTWADWVGDWHGKLAWTSCTSEGAGSAALAIDATDGVIGIDLAPAGGALDALTLVEDGSGWSGRQGDVAVHLARASDHVDLAVDLDSGCQIRGKLERSSNGIAACDRLEAWARIEAHCTRLSRPALENPARLVRQRETWTAAKGDARAKLAAQCDARAGKVETELVDAGCAPNRDPAIGLRGAECQALRTSADRLARCTAVPPDVEIALEHEVSGLVSAAQVARDAELRHVEAACHALRARILVISQQSACLP